VLAYFFFAARVFASFTASFTAADCGFGAFAFERSCGDARGRRGWG
jgi:hypothetical protein